MEKNGKRAKTTSQFFGEGRNLAKLDFPYQITMKGKMYNCKIIEFQDDGKFCVQREGRIYAQITSVLAFLFETEHFHGRVPSEYTSAQETEYLKEAGIVLRERDEYEDACLTYPPWIFYVIQEGRKKICKYIDTVNRGLIKVAVLDEFGTRNVKNLYLAVNCGQYKMGSKVKSFHPDTFEEYIRFAEGGEQPGHRTPTQGGSSMSSPPATQRSQAEGGEQPGHRTPTQGGSSMSSPPATQRSQAVLNADEEEVESADEEEEVESAVLNADEEEVESADEEEEVESDPVTLRFSDGTFVYVGERDVELNKLPRKKVSRKRSGQGFFKTREVRSLLMHLQEPENWPENGLICSCLVFHRTAAGIQSHCKRQRTACTLYRVVELKRADGEDKQPS